MTPHQVEHRVLQLADQVRARRPNEDSRVELKREWPAASDYKTARHLAALANAARLDEILWVIGLDEKAGIVVGAAAEELANWWPQIRAHFNGVAPTLVHAVNVTIDAKVVVGLVFDTSRAPFVVTIPNNGALDRDVPWREGNSLRSATREDLIRILVPAVRTPRFEVHDATARLLRPSPGAMPKKKTIELEVRGYLVHLAEGRVHIPDHGITGVFKSTGGATMPATWGHLKPKMRPDKTGEGSISVSVNPSFVRTDHDLTALGPGHLTLTVYGELAKEVAQLGGAPPNFAYDDFGDTATMSVEVRATILGADVAMIVSLHRMVPCTPNASDDAAWTWDREA